eukprot:3933342-Rhodomonas_salina.1
MPGLWLAEFRGKKVTARCHAYKYSSYTGPLFHHCCGYMPCEGMPPMAPGGIIPMPGGIIPMPGGIMPGMPPGWPIGNPVSGMVLYINWLCRCGAGVAASGATPSGLKVSAGGCSRANTA